MSRRGRRARRNYLGARQIIWYRAVIQKHKCYMCACPIERFPCEVERWRKATIDHVMPSSRGGANQINNTLFACSRCNQRKWDRLPYPCEMVFLAVVNDIFRSKVNLLHGRIPKPLEYMREPIQ